MRGDLPAFVRYVTSTTAVIMHPTSDSEHQCVRATVARLNYRGVTATFLPKHPASCPIMLDAVRRRNPPSKFSTKRVA
jgi:hypothetical protein